MSTHASNIPADEVMGFTQAQPAEKIGVHKSNISEMWRDKRPIGKAMEKRLSEVLSCNYKVFL